MFKQYVAEAVGKATDLPVEKICDLLEIPPDSTLGDYAFPCFTLGKPMNKSPVEVAAVLAERVKTDEVIVQVSHTGPYINFFISEAAWVKKVIESTESLWQQVEENQTILIEFPSPNTNKPLHVGHVRNMVLGTAVSALLRRSGEKVITVNLNNDRGIHICKSMLAYQKWGADAEPDKKSDHFIGDFYVRFEQEAKKDESLLVEAQEMLQQWEAGDKKVRTLWKKMNAWALKGFAETYERYQVSFDTEYSESDIYTEGKKLIEKHIDLFEKEDGAIVANLEKYKLPNKILLRADGTSIYMTQDLALTQRKMKDFNPDKQVWVVANEQNLHFQQLFAILEMMGTPRTSFFHLSYGMVELPDGKMKSREGRVVDADDLLDEVQRLATEQVKSRHDDWPDERVTEVAEWLAMGAIRFFILKYDAAKNFVFDPQSSVSFEGDTGPYLQYTHARLRSIIRKAGGVPEADVSVLGSEEREVCLAVSGLQRAFVQAAGQFQPHALAQQLLSLGRAINSYYHAHPVLKAEEDVRAARLMFLDALTTVLGEGLRVLGIHAPEEM